MSLEVDGVWKAGVWATTVWADGVWREGAAPVVVDTEQPGSGGRAVRRKERWSLTVDGEPLVFDSFDALMAYIASQEEEKVESVEAKAEQDAGRIVLVGRKKAKPAPPVIAMASPVEEVRDRVAEVQAHVDRAYWKALSAALARQAEEEEDIRFIASIQ